MTKEILEYIPVTCRILDERTDRKGDPTLRVLVKWQVAGKVNGNKRLYRRELLEREIKRLTPAMENHEVWGAAYHPEDGVGRTSDITHSWEKVWMEKNGECFGEIEVLPTSNGKDLQVILRKGKIGMSSRGRGTLTRKTGVVEGQSQEYDEVNDDYFMLTPGDFVLGPSVDDAGPVKILESRLNGDAGEGEAPDEEEIQEGFLDLRQAIEDEARAQIDPSCWVKSISDKVAIVSMMDSPIAGKGKEALFSVPYEVADDEEIILDLENIEKVKQETVYEPVINQGFDELKFGKLSEQEMRLTGCRQLGKPRGLELTPEEQRYLSPKEAALLREEKFGIGKK